MQIIVNGVIAGEIHISTAAKRGRIVFDLSVDPATNMTGLASVVTNVVDASCIIYKGVEHTLATVPSRFDFQNVESSLYLLCLNRMGSNIKMVVPVCSV
jgi:hypothetical protein